MAAQKPILIIGAGLAGLSLGQGLKQAGIPFKIFERDQAVSFRAQGYRIRIDQQGGDGLKRLLPPHLFDLFEATSAPVISGGHRLDAFTLDEITGLGGMPPQFGKAWNADRTVLRNVLLTGIEEYIAFDKKFQGYTLTEDGVTAHFTDDSEVSGSLLIGADGVRSHVRKQMLPDSILLDTEGRAVFGKTPITEDTFTTIPKEIDSGINLVIPPSEPRMKLFTDMMRFKRTSDTDASANNSSNTTIDLPQDYIYWVLVFQKSYLDTPSSPLPPNMPSDNTLLSLSPTSSATLATSLTAPWHHSLQSIITNAHPTASSTLQFLMAKPPLSPWPSDTRVTLMGDAAHPMPPVGGVGANVAFRDAADLLDIVRDGVSEEGLAGYEKVMRERSSEALVRSAFGATRFFGMKPVEELGVVR